MPVDGAVLQDRYQILSKLSDKGGMGVVYLAEDRRLGSEVVVKEIMYLQLKPEVRDIALKTFFREARLLANLRHAALPRVTDYFSEGDGHFLVMEFIPGKDLEELLASRGEAFPVEDVLQWADRLLEAMEYLHGHDEPIVHRDIKPSNLKLTPRGEVMLLDFGLAKGAVVGAQAASSVFGYTKQYAPLEQIKGTGTDARSNLFSLAATLYHLLTGHAPPDAIERISEVAMGNLDPLKPVAEVNRSVPAIISTLISSALALKPDDRPATATAMRQALLESMKRSCFDGSDNLPVEYVSWSDAKEFCRKLSRMTGKQYRLPSEAEWEYACRAGTTSDYAGSLDVLGWYVNNSGLKWIDDEILWDENGDKYSEHLANNENSPHPVGQKQPNEFGLYDMHGNVWEWCEDIWHDNYENAPNDASAWLTEGDQNCRVLRGGSWASHDNECRSAFRLYNDSSDLKSDIGFRVVVSVEIA